MLLLTILEFSTAIFSTLIVTSFRVLPPLRRSGIAGNSTIKATIAPIAPIRIALLDPININRIIGSEI
jgi:hypothetical protein